MYGSVSCVFFVQVCLCVISKKHKRDEVYFGLYGQIGGVGGGGQDQEAASLNLSSGW